MALENRIIWGNEGQGQYFGFDDMAGALHLPREQVQAIVRLGANGERIRRTGTRAIPSQITTFLYVASLSDGKNLFTNDYEPLIDGAGYEIKQYGQSFGNFRILSLVQQPFRAVSSVVGHIGGGTPTYLQIIDWTVLAVTP